MAKFKPGHKGGPGRPKDPPDIKSAKMLNKLEFERLLNRFLHTQYSDLLAYLTAKQGTIMELAIAKIALKAYEQADTGKMAYLTERLIGKVPEVVEQHNFSEESDRVKSLVEMLKEVYADRRG